MNSIAEKYIRQEALPFIFCPGCGHGIVGKLIGERAVAAGITEVVFDRGGNVYHGRVKALAEGAREGGLKF